MTVNRIDNIKDAPEKTLSRVIGHASDGKGGGATLANLKGQLSITAADVSGAVPETRQIATSGGIQGGGTLDNDLTLSLTDTGVDADTYGSATEIPVLTIGADGRVADAQNTAIAITAADVSGGYPIFTSVRWAVPLIAASGANCDDFTVGGYYQSDLWSNSPLGAAGGQLDVRPSYGSNYVRQVWTDNVLGRQWLRIRFDGVWGTWKEYVFA